ncbi:hypothetical protein [Isoptericola aurantiacus]|uniref:hypothetical protein n=1 Tax=Isoptericola aurantiacus TaxID=3377839 RepID=UPI00383B9F2D
MRSPTSRRFVGRTVVAVLAAATLATSTLPASASDPASTSVTVATGSATFSFSDTVVSQGDDVSLTMEYTNSTNATIYASGGLYAYTDELTAIFDLNSCTVDDPSGDCDSLLDGIALRGRTDVPPSGTETVEFDLQVRSDAAPGTYEIEPDVGLGTSFSSNFTPVITITVLEPAADLDVGLSATGSLLTSQISYTLKVSNDGPAAATASTVDVALPAQTGSVSGLPATCTYSSATDVVTCETGAIASGDTVTRNFKANVVLLSHGSLTATASRVSSSPSDPNAANDTATKTCQNLLGVVITC